MKKINSAHRCRKGSLGRRNRCILIIICVVCALFSPVQASADRIKTIANFEGVRSNQLVGYGLIMGLSGTGDTGLATIQAVANILQRLGLTVSVNDLKSKDVAAVMITAMLPTFPKPGVKVDALVSALGDAKSLQGGTLLLSPLRGPDGKVYALAQGPVSIGGFVGGGGGTSTQKNHPTTGNVPNGAIVENEPHFKLGDGNEIRLFLNRPDFTIASLIAQRINEALTSEYALTVDPATVRVKIPPLYKEKVVELIAFVEGLDVAVDIPARVIINERTGTVVVGDTVKISPVAISHGSLTVEIKTEFQVSQPAPFAPKGAETVVVPQKEVTVKEQKTSLVEVSGVTLSEIVRALNALGVTPRDLISILQALKASGALRAELEII
jgi:flagellar P-ring protein precursor FlgI